MVSSQFELQGYNIPVEGNQARLERERARGREERREGVVIFFLPLSIIVLSQTSMLLCWLHNSFSPCLSSSQRCDVNVMDGGLLVIAVGPCHSPEE